MFKKLLGVCLALCLWGTNAVATVTYAQAKQGDTYYRIVVASDVHYPSKFNAKKKPLERARTIYHKYKAVEDINSWQDVDLVVFTGDMIARVGSDKAYAEASEFTHRVEKPKAFVAGNHEYFYSTKLTKKNKVKTAKPAERIKELKRFKKYFATPELYYTKQVDNYLLVFLSPDNPEAKDPTEMSAQELAWLKQTLESNRDKPTIAFFHGPLVGTLKSYTPKVNGPRYIAQPADKLDAIIKANPQLKLWVSGHTHTSPTNPSFKNKVNWYEGQLLDVHNPAWEGKQIWTNSLFLYPHKIVAKTYDHKEHKFIDSFTRTVKL